ncbi:MAG: metallophosphoesterase [Opitutales bacterium]|nr:metallophosphoesterase [Opitutales bacterium]
MTAFIFLLIVALALLIYAWQIEPRRLTLTPVKIELAGTLPPTKILLLGDLHLGKNDRSRAEKIVGESLKRKPDAVCLLGDYANRHSDKDSMSPDEVAQILAAFPRAGVPTFAVLGNHDAYIGRQDFAKAFRKVGIRVFAEKDTEEVTLGNGARMLFAGTLDPHSFSDIFDTGSVPVNTTGLPCVLLSHSPDVVPFLNPTVDLAFCGHTHGGQVRLPFVGALVSSTKRVGREYAYGLHTAETGTRIFVTRGLGQSILPLRFCCPPEIVEVALAGTEAKD